MNNTIAGIIKLAIGRAKSASEFVMLISIVDDLYMYEVITDFGVFVDLKTQIGVSYIEWLETNETEGNK